MRELPPPAVHASRNAWDAKSQALRGLVIGIIAAAVLAYLGAMGTQAAPFLQRFAYWAAVILPGSLLGLGVNALVRGWGGGDGTLATSQGYVVNNLQSGPSDTMFYMFNKPESEASAVVF